MVVACELGAQLGGREDSREATYTSLRAFNLLIDNV
jgi:hypothetical protein